MRTLLLVEPGQDGSQVDYHGKGIGSLRDRDVRSATLLQVGSTINIEAGTTLPAATVTREITRARATDVVIPHGGGTAPGLTRALKIMKDSGETCLLLPRANCT